MKTKLKGGAMMFLVAVAFGQQVQAISLPADHNIHKSTSEERWMLMGRLKDNEGNGYYFSTSFAKAKIGFLKLIAQVLVIYDERNEKYYFDYSVSKLKKGTINSLPEGEFNLAFGKGYLRSAGANQFKMKLLMKNIGIEADFQAQKPVVIHGKNGQIEMGRGGKANFYSITRMKTTGSIRLGDRKIPVNGICWFDRQWGNWKDQGEGFAGWDWFNIHLEDGRDVNIISFREMKTGRRIAPYIAIIDKKGKAEFYSNVEIKPISFWKSLETNISYPVSWRINIPEKGLDIEISAEKNRQEIFMKFLWIKRIMWDGACNVTIKESGNTVSGSAYIKLSGYK